MTNEEHNRYLGVGFLVYSGFQALMALLIGGMMLAIIGSAPPDAPTGFFLFDGACRVTNATLLILNNSVSMRHSSVGDRYGIHFFGNRIKYIR